MVILGIKKKILNNMRLIQLQSLEIQEFKYLLDCEQKDIIKYTFLKNK